MMGSITAQLTAILASTGLTGLFFAMVLESALMPLPSEVILPFAGVLVAQHHLTFWGAVGWAVAGQMTGSLLTYWLGHAGGRALVLRYGRYILLRREELARADGWFKRHGDIMVFLARLLPAVRGVISLPAGIAGMPIVRFLVYSFLGTLPWTALLVWAGVRLGRVWEDPRWRPLFRTAEAAIWVGLAALVVWYVVWRARQERDDA